jgi:putative transposase
MPARKEPVLPDDVVDQLMSGRDPSTVFDKNGLLDALRRAIAERALNVEMEHHRVTEAADGGSNSRNG